MQQENPSALYTNPEKTFHNSLLTELLKPSTMKMFSDRKTTPPPDGYILLADDDQDDRFMMKDFFLCHGYNGVFLNSGLAVLEYLRSQMPAFYPSLVLLDYSMPLLNGEKTLATIKTSPMFMHIPVIIYSSEMNNDLATRLKHLGALACFTKALHTSEWKRMKEVIDASLLR